MRSSVSENCTCKDLKSTNGFYMHCSLLVVKLYWESARHCQERESRSQHAQVIFDKYKEHFISPRPI
jgi:hypothetical protein